MQRVHWRLFKSEKLPNYLPNYGRSIISLSASLAAPVKMKLAVSRLPPRNYPLQIFSLLSRPLFPSSRRHFWSFCDLVASGGIFFGFSSACQIWWEYSEEGRTRTILRFLYLGQNAVDQMTIHRHFAFWLNLPRTHKLRRGRAQAPAGCCTCCLKTWIVRKHKVKNRRKHRNSEQKSSLLFKWIKPSSALLVFSRGTITRQR